MIHSSIRNLTLALALILPPAASALAQAVPTLRDSVTVTSDIVRIGDLVDNAGAVANVPIFRSPDLGTRGAVATDRIIEAIRPHQLIDIDTRGLAEVVVTRASRTISSQEISARIAALLAGRYSLGEARDIAITFDHEARSVQVEPSASGELQAVSLVFDPRTGRFDATFDLPSSAVLHRQPARFTGIAVETIDAIAVAHPVEHGEILTESDLTVLRRPKSEGGAITDINAVIGLSPRRQLRPGQPLHAADLMRPEIVQRNDTVTIVYQVPGLTLTLRGQAQEAGALGDSISVLNLQSKRMVQGIVSGPGRVTVKPVATRVVDNGSEVAVPAQSIPPERQD